MLNPLSLKSLRVTRAVCFEDGAACPLQVTAYLTEHVPKDGRTLMSAHTETLDPDSWPGTAPLFELLSTKAFETASKDDACEWFDTLLTQWALAHSLHRTSGSPPAPVHLGQIAVAALELRVQKSAFWDNLTRSAALPPPGTSRPLISSPYYMDCRRFVQGLGATIAESAAVGCVLADVSLNKQDGPLDHARQWALAPDRLASQMSPTLARYLQAVIHAAEAVAVDDAPLGMTPTDALRYWAPLLSPSLTPQEQLQHHSRSL